MKYTDIKDWHAKKMKGLEYKKAYDSLEVEFQIIRAILRKRIANDMTQQDLARKIGSDQATISRLESGDYNPSLNFLKRIATALDAKLKVTML